MEIIHKSHSERLKYFVNKIYDDNLFLLSSSISYYSALALAPFVMILLAVASFLKQNIQSEIIQEAYSASPELGTMIKLVFSNVNEGLSLGSISGLIGGIVLLWTASLVFLQFRYSFDVIYGDISAESRKSIWEIVKDKIFAMFIVLAAGLFIILTLSLNHIVGYLYGSNFSKTPIVKFLFFNFNFVIYYLMFLAIHHFIPTRKPKFSNVTMIALLSTVFFIIGNYLLTFYLKNIASGSIYGATGSLFVFLVWSFYSSFTIFLSIEVFLYLKHFRKAHKI